jgi:ABC-type uncharacterized transport system permease subunit
MIASVYQATLTSAVAAALPILLAGLGVLINEKVGVVNVGVEGVMLIGAAVGFIVAVETDSTWLGLAAGSGAGAALTFLCFGIPVLFFRAPQILTGFGLWLIGAGLSDQLGQDYTSAIIDNGTAEWDVPLLRDIPFIGSIFFRQTVLAYIAVLLALLVGAGLRWTRHGRNMRALGEDPASAHAAGISVRGWRSLYVSVGGALMGCGGAVLSVIVAQNWQSQMTSGRGFIAFALVIFVGWRAVGLVWASYVFGVLLLLGQLGQAQGWRVPSQFLDMTPYLFTIAVLSLRSWRELRSGAGTAAPASLGLDFIRGQR